MIHYENQPDTQMTLIDLEYGEFFQMQPHSDDNQNKTEPATVQDNCSSDRVPSTSQSTMQLCEDSVREQLKQVIDPELFVNIVDLGLIYVVDIVASETEAEKSDVHIEMTLTSPMCPAGPQLVANSRQVVESLPGVSKVDVKVVMDPPWTPDMMTEDARDHLNIF